MEEALALHRELGDPWRIGDDVHTLGYIARRERRLAGGPPALRGERAAGSGRRVTRTTRSGATRSLGWTYHDTGDFARAREIHEANLRRAREVGNRAVEATTLGVLGTILVDERACGGGLPVPRAGVPAAPGARRARSRSRSTCCVSPRRSPGSGERRGGGRADVSLSRCAPRGARGEGPWVERKAEETLAAVREQLDPADVRGGVGAGEAAHPGRRRRTSDGGGPVTIRPRR